MQAVFERLQRERTATDLIAPARLPPYAKYKGCGVTGGALCFDLVAMAGSPRVLTGTRQNVHTDAQDLRRAATLEPLRRTARSSGATAFCGGHAPRPRLPLQHRHTQ